MNTPRLSKKMERDEAEAREKRIRCRHETGRIFESMEDLRWLYFDLALRGALEEWDTERDLENFVREPIWESLWHDKSDIGKLTKQASRYIERPLFHCTALRDLLVVHLIESLLTHVRDPIKDRLVIALRPFLAGFLIVVAAALYIFVSWWAAAIVGFMLIVKALGWVRELDHMHKCKVRNQFTRDKINEIIATVKRGGCDEPTVIRQLEIFDDEIPPLPKLVKIYGSPYLLGSDPTGIQEHTIPIPSVLYALLRLPRRNVQSEISANFSALNERKRDELARRWRKFVDTMLNYDEPRRAV